MVPAAGLLGAARLALRVAVGGPTALKLACGQLPLHGVSEPGLFYVAGSTDRQLGIGPLSIDFNLCGAGCRIRTRDLRFTKPLHYHCAKPAVRARL
jgi:hypothetical protein